MSSPYTSGEDRFGHYDPNAGLPVFGSSPYGGGTDSGASTGGAGYAADPVHPYGSPLYGTPPSSGYGAVQPVGPGAVQPYGYVPSRKDPALALIASFFIPGLGSMINGEVGKGIGILALYAISIPLMFVVIGIPMLLGTWIWGMVDGYQGAERHNRRYGLY